LQLFINLNPSYDVGRLYDMRSKNALPIED